MLELTLASASPRRAALLASAGVAVFVDAVACDETAARGEVATAYARRIARVKLHAALARGPHERPVLTADTVVWRPHPPDPIGKPKDRDEAAAILRTLCDGSPHRVTTAFCVGFADAAIVVGEATTVVWMRSLRDAEREAYLDTEEWRDKAGGYGIQGAAAAIVTRIEGSYTNVVGLPLAQVIEVLQRGRAR